MPEIDSAQCVVIAMRAVPSPSSHLEQSRAAEPTNYSVDGTVTTYGPNGEVSTGHYSGTATASGYHPSDESNSGLAFVQALTDQANADKARKNLADACMFERGWVIVPRQ